MGSFPAARSISIVKALLSQVPPEQTPIRWEGTALEIQLYKHVAQPCSFISLLLRTLCAPLWPFPSAPGPALAWLWHEGSAPTPTSKRWCLAYRAQQGMQSQAPVTGRTSYSLIHLHRDQAEIHYSRLCIRPNKVKQPCLTEKTAPPCLYRPATALCNPKLELGSETTQITWINMMPKVFWLDSLCYSFSPAGKHNY